MEILKHVMSDSAHAERLEPGPRTLLSTRPPDIWYDAMMRLPIVAFELFFLVREISGIRQFIAAHPYFGGDWWFFIALEARVSLVIFIAVLVILHVSRRRPVQKYAVWAPKMTALLGTLLTYSILLMPRSEPAIVWDGLSVAMTLTGTMLAILAVLQLGRSMSVMPEARKLVNGGLYAWVRHPLYLAEEIATIGFSLQFRAWPTLAILLAHLYFQIRRMDWEEKVLDSAFPEYSLYKEGTHRLIPGIY